MRGASRNQAYAATEGGMLPLVRAVYFASDASRFHAGGTVVIDGAYSIF